jgi:hypothetical protein
MVVVVKATEAAAVVWDIKKKVEVVWAWRCLMMLKS